METMSVREATAPTEYSHPPAMWRPACVAKARRLIVALLATLALMLAPLATATDSTSGDLLVVTEPFPPIGFEGTDGNPDGLGVEMVEQIMARLGVRHSIEIWPWARAFETAKREPNIVLFTLARVPWRENDYHWIGHVYSTKSAIYTLRAAGHSLADLDAAKRIGGIATARGTFNERYLESQGFENLVPAKSQAQNLRKLLDGRVDAIALSDTTLEGFVEDLGMELDAFERQVELLPGDNQIILSKGTAPEIVAAWRAAYEALAAEGAFDALRAKWLP